MARPYPILLIFVNGWLRRLRRVVCPAGRRRCSLELALARRSHGWDSCARPAALRLARWAVTSRRRSRVSTGPGFFDGLRNATEALALEPQLEHLAHNVLCLGRGTNYPIALEGGLKLKEISYIHAEGCVAGELKHGPIALIDDKMPGNVTAPYDRMFKKVSNMQEVPARDGKIILLSDPQGAHDAHVDSLRKLTLPALPPTVIRLSYCRGDGERGRLAAKPCQVGHRGMIEGSAS
jgi:SIS domain